MVVLMFGEEEIDGLRRLKASRVMEEESAQVAVAGQLIGGRGRDQQRCR